MAAYVLSIRSNPQNLNSFSPTKAIIPQVECSIAMQHPIQCDSVGRGPWFGWLWFLSFNRLPGSAWADRNLPELSGQLGKMVEHPNQSRPNPIKSATTRGTLGTILTLATAV